MGMSLSPLRVAVSAGPESVTLASASAQVGWTGSAKTKDDTSASSDTATGIAKLSEKSERPLASLPVTV